MARGFDDVPDNTGYDSVRLDEIVELWMPSKEATTAMDIRILPHSMLPVKTHWIEIVTKKGTIKVPRVCVSFNPDNQSEPLDGRECPYCKLDHSKEGGVASAQIYYYANAIIRDEQQNEPAKRRAPTKDEAKTGIKDINSKTWTPVRVVQLTGGVARKLKDMAAANKAKIKGESKAFPVNHEKFGVDISIKYNPKASGEAKYAIEKTERTPMTEDEKEYLYYDLEDAESIYDKIGRLDTKAAVKDLNALKINGKSREDEDEDDEEGYRAKSKSKRRDEDDDEEGYKPKRGASKFDDDDDEDDEPKPRRKKSRDTSDDDEDEEDLKPKRKRSRDTSDEDEDEPKPRRKKPARDTSDDDDEDEPKPRRKKSRDTSDDDDEPAPKRKRKSRFEDDDE